MENNVILMAGAIGLGIGLVTGFLAGGGLVLLCWLRSERWRKSCA